ncbi:MAG TPA: ABC transporter ATP-binding protein [Micromonosporaceae bacterium]|jgi:putative ABC transport system ATP-binding protein|nr:ABC transporter ATP-binding protein [Micromonosporaceae bacterium]
MTEVLLAARGVVKSYGNSPALRGVTIDVGEGEIVAVTGPSGCGKSTLLYCLSGIMRPDAGEISYRGARLDTRTESERSALRRGDFGLLFQFGQLVAELPAVDNVALPLLLRGTRRREARSAAMVWLDRLGVADVGRDLPGEMSGGQAQRVALGRALVTEPRVLFADEPTGALDTLTGEAVLGHIVRVVREQGTAVVLVTHEATVAAHADREVALRDGMLDPTGLGFPMSSPAAAGTGPAAAGPRHAWASGQ